MPTPFASSVARNSSISAESRSESAVCRVRASSESPILAAIWLRAASLSSIHHSLEVVAADRGSACDEGVFKDKILFNGFRASTRVWGARFARWVWSFPLIGRSLFRALMTSAALSAGVLLAGCNSDEINSLATNAKANQPVPPKLLAQMEAKDMDLQSPILVRLFKQEAELEVWKQDRS